MPGYPVLRHRYNPGNTDSKCDPANRDPQERAESIDERERPGQSRSDGKTHADKTRGVIEQGLAFKNVHQTLGDRYAGSDCGYGNRVRRRNDRGEREGDGDRHLRDHPVDKETNAHDCEYDEAECEFQDRSLVTEQTLLGNAPAVQKEKRRQKQQEENIRLQCDAEIGSIQPLGAQLPPTTGFGGDRDAVAAARRAVGMRLSEPRTGPSTRCRRRDYEGMSSTLGTAVAFPSPYTLQRWFARHRCRA